MTRSIQTILTDAIEAAGLSLKEVARQLGDRTEGNLAMILQGITRVPLHRIPALARILQLDERSLVLSALEEYDPEVLERVMRIPGISQEDAELGLLVMYRMASLRKHPCTADAFRQTIETEWERFAPQTLERGRSASGPARPAAP